MMGRNGFTEKDLLRTKQGLQQKIQILNDRIAVIDRVIQETKEDNGRDVQESILKEIR